MLGRLLATAAALPDRLHNLAVGKGFTTDVHPGFPAYVGGGGVGGWASNHWQESRLLTGRAFTAIRAIARTCAKAQPQVLAVGGRFDRTMRKALREHRLGRLSTEALTFLKANVQASADGGDGVPVSKGDPMLRLLSRPNPWMTRGQFLFQHAQQACATGTTLLWTRRNEWREFDTRGVPSQLFIIPTGVSYPQPPTRSQPEGSYKITPVGSFGGIRGPAADAFGDASWSNLMISGGTIDGREIRPIRWPHPIFLTDGQSPMDAGQKWIDISMQLDNATWYGLKNTLRPGYIFQMANGFEEPSLAESIRFDREIEARIAGLDNVGRHMRLPKGIEIADSDRSVQEIGWIDGRAVIAGDVDSLWAVHPVISGRQPPGAYAAYIAAMICFAEQAIEPVLSLLADDLQDELDPGFGGGREVRIPAPRVNDQQQMLAELEAAAGNQAVSVNDVRKKLGMEPWPEWADMPVGTDCTRAAAQSLGLDPELFQPAQPPGPEGGPPAKNGQKPKKSAPSGGGAGEPPERVRGANERNPAARNKPRTGPANGKVSDVSTSRRQKAVGINVPMFLKEGFHLNGFHEGKA